MTTTRSNFVVVARRAAPPPPAAAAAATPIAGDDDDDDGRPRRRHRPVRHDHGRRPVQRKPRRPPRRGDVLRGPLVRGRGGGRGGTEAKVAVFVVFVFEVVVVRRSLGRGGGYVVVRVVDDPVSRGHVRGAAAFGVRTALLGEGDGPAPAHAPVVRGRGGRRRRPRLRPTRRADRELGPDPTRNDWPSSSTR